MKEFVLESEVPVVGACAPPALREKLAAFVELTKPRITLLIVLTSAAGFCLGSKGQTDYLALTNALAGILFAWQFPHFLAIAWMYREDYARAGILMLPVVEPDGRLTSQQIVIWTLLLVPVSLFPAALGTTGAVYFYGAFLLGLLFLGASIHAAVSNTRRGARRLLLASVLYL